MKKFFTLGIWVFITPLFLISLIGVSYKLTQKETIFLHPPYAPGQLNQTLGASDPVFSENKGFSTGIQSGDARPIIIAAFLEQHDSPLKPYDYWGEFLTDLADKYELDFRLLPSISMQESNLCKKIPEGTYNCLGLGIHSRGTWGFDRFEDNFEAAAKILKHNYIDKGYVTPDEIQDKYTPSSNGSWEFAVNHFMDTLETAEFIP